MFSSPFHTFRVPAFFLSDGAPNVSLKHGLASLLFPSCCQSVLALLMRLFFLSNYFAMIFVEHGSSPFEFFDPMYPFFFFNESDKFSFPWHRANFFFGPQLLKWPGLFPQPFRMFVFLFHPPPPGKGAVLSPACAIFRFSVTPLAGRATPAPRLLSFTALHRPPSDPGNQTVTLR